ncbi:methyltransferase domain-containing protein [Caulobacter henricii]|uniref:methyltransferase domain-containing protein n=1 Tax=Caulobacter henricii TaxID=69395 RepID=UPI000ADC9534|nr:methyltransferase domain-containing protein [Caulobacter henricii]
MTDDFSAEDWLQQAVEASNDGRHTEARTAFTRALALDPALGEAHLGLGLSYMATRDFAEAVAPLRAAAATPDAPALWQACLAQGLYMTGDFAGCAEAFERAAALEPLATNARLTHARARTFATMIEGSVEAALERYAALAGEGAEDIEVIAREAFAILGVFGHAEAAAALGAWRLARQPDDQIQAYLLQAVSGAAVDRAPPAYVEAHFDSFADKFDHQLVNLLNYRAPERMAELVARHVGSFGAILDLGCGTGLSAPALAQFGGHLTGVDLSGAMLDHARARGGYDALVQGEAIAFLTDHPGAFDLIFAADMVIYFGDLSDLFRAAAGALRPGGLFTLSTESGTGTWTLLSSGRFAHADAYVAQAAGAGWTLLDQESLALRHEGTAPVQGSLHVFQKSI